jgi:hypothetical protein
MREVKKQSITNHRLRNLIVLITNRIMKLFRNTTHNRPHGRTGGMWSAIGVHFYAGLILLLLTVSSFSNLNGQTVIIELEDTTQKPWQYKMPPKFSFGLRAGLNVAQIFGTGSQVFNHFGFSGGVRFGYRFHRNFSFDPEILYNMKGAARYPNVEKGDYYSFSVDLDYIEIPMLFNFYFGKRKNFSVEFGPSIGFLVRQKAFENQQPINTTNTGFNVYDISLAVGLNYYMPKGFGLNFRFMNSIVPIQPTYGTLPWGVSSINIGQLNSVLNFSLLYKFDLRSKEQKLLDGDGPKEKHTKVRIKKEKGNVVDEDE